MSCAAPLKSAPKIATANTAVIMLSASMAKIAAKQTGRHFSSKVLGGDPAREGFFSKKNSRKRRTTWNEPTSKHTYYKIYWNFCSQ